MGRGRAKAKQTKVARELKYHSPTTDLAALQRELASNGKSNDEFDRHGEFDDDVDDEEDGDADQTALHGQDTQDRDVLQGGAARSGLDGDWAHRRR